MTTATVVGNLKSMRMIQVLIFLITLMGITFDAWTAVTCPPYLENTNQTLKDVPPAWKLKHSKLKHTLNGFRVNFGDPEQHENDGAIYDDLKRTKTKSGIEETLTWNLKGMSDPVAVCSYFGTSIELVRSVKGLSKCEAISTEGKKDIRTKCY